MTNALSVIIVNRDEPMLLFTIRRAMETADCPIEVIVVDDGSVNPPRPEMTRDLLRGHGKTVRVCLLPKPIGLAYCRDFGIERAANDACLLLDAHTNFEAGGHGWASYCRDHALRFPRHFGCCVSVQLDSDPWNGPAEQMDMTTRTNEDSSERDRSAYYGAVIQIMAKSGRPFPSKWHGDYRHLLDSGGFGVIQSSLGGHYVLNREWYMKTLMRPWRENRAWGSSEQTITIANWLCGGDSVLLPIRMGHQYRTGKQARTPYPCDEHILTGQIWNQWKLVNMLPLTDGMRAQLSHIITDLNPRPRVLNALNHDRGQVKVYREYLEKQKRSMAEYFERWAMDTYIPTLDEIRAGWEPGIAEGK